MVSKSLDPRFKGKLTAIMERIVMQWLTPKSLTNSHDGSTCYISGSDPLFELLHSTIEAPTTEIAWDWQGTLQRFQEKATLERLEAQVAFLADQYRKAKGGRCTTLTIEAHDLESGELLKEVWKHAQELFPVACVSAFFGFRSIPYTAFFRKKNNSIGFATENVVLPAGEWP